MTSLPRNRWPEGARLAALLQAALLAASLVAAPTIHRYTCSGVCSGARFVTWGERACGGCCHGGDAGAPSGARGGSGRGCTCLDDCCSWHALFTTPDAPSDTAPATLVAAAPVAAPIDAPRAPGARLLPYPTGPPSEV